MAEVDFELMAELEVTGVEFIVVEVEAGVEFIVFVEAKVEQTKAGWGFYLDA